ncbi:MAG: RNA polymerase sigma factor [Ignavibacteria bacterium]|nr:RNA polymerase sigma factor [Ignavibacteria bacterium]
MTDLEFRDFVDTYRVKALSMARRMLKNDEDARDAVQESFVRAFRNMHKFRGDASIGTWLYRIVYTTCLNILRSQHRMPLHESLNENESPVWIEPEIFDTIDQATIEDILQEEMSAMPTLYAVVMDLFYVQDCSYEQIVSITGMSLGTVKTRLNRGRLMLRDAIRSRLEPTPSFAQGGNQ